MNTATPTALTLAACLLCTAAHAATTLTYTYDDLNRLTAVSRGDGPTLSYSYDEAGNITVRTATNPDTDGDGLTDVVEINTWGTNPGLTDTDVDGLSDGAEVNIHGTSPTNLDSDGDSANDGAEITAGTNPLDPNSYPTVATGDLDGNGVVNIADVLLGQRILTGLHSPTAAELSRGDVAPLVNGVPQPNGTFNLGDLLLIERKVLGQVNY